MTGTIGRPRAGAVDVDGARLQYLVEGEGQACLVLGSRTLYARTFSSSLREHVRLVFVDLRHFAPSDPDFVVEQITIDTYTDDIDRVRQALGLEDVVVVGHSIHAVFAVEYARRHPGQVRGVVLIGAAPYASEADYDAAFDQLWAGASDERKTLRAQRQAELTPELVASLSPSALYVRQYVARGPLLWYEPTFDSSSLWEGVEMSLPVWHRLGELVEAYDLEQGPGPIMAPVLITVGRHDYRNPYTLWERKRDTLPNHTFVLFEKSGHNPQLEEPDRFDEVLLTWIDGLGRYPE